MMMMNYRHSYEQNVHIFTNSFNDANQINFHYKQFESVKMLQIEFDTNRIWHDGFCSFVCLYRWNFLSSLLKKCWCHFQTVLYMQLHSCSNLAHVHGYNSDNGSFWDCVVSHCVQMCLLYFFLFFLFSTFSLFLLCCSSCE